MAAYVLRRLVLMVIVLLGVITITFVVARIVPADPVSALLGPNAPEDLIRKVRAEWGLDKPLGEQYVDYISGLLRGDLGKSIKTNRPVIEDLKQFFPATIELATFSLLIAIAIGIPIGIVSAIKKDTWIDHVSRVMALIGVSTPVFWLGIVLLFIFYYWLGILPGPGQLDPGIERPPTVTGMILLDSLIAGNFEAFKNALYHLILPSFVLGYFSSAYIMRITRASLLEVLDKEYIRTAKAKGLKDRIILYRHALRNAMIPTVTVIGITYGSLLEGAVLTETIFAWPGLGRYSTSAFLAMDLNAVMGSVLLIALVYSLANLIVDIAYAYLDPRIRVAYTGE
ncbi:MAG: ABC transporter permease [Desulfurococcales archaeon]|nr:ABC transporter permease [Desulfurococcales archaeon]